jgi:hypothetical protein
MKTKLTIVTIAIIALSIFASLSSALAADYSVILNVSNQDGTWVQFDTMKLFSGKLVDTNSVVFNYWTQATPSSPLEGPFLLAYSRVSLADSQVKIFFNIATLPANIVKTTVTGTLEDGSTFVATGPGWAFTMR